MAGIEPTTDFFLIEFISDFYNKLKFSLRLFIGKRHQKFFFSFFVLNESFCNQTEKFNSFYTFL